MSFVSQDGLLPAWYAMLAFKGHRAAWCWLVEQHACSMIGGDADITRFGPEPTLLHRCQVSSIAPKDAALLTCWSGQEASRRYRDKKLKPHSNAVLPPVGQQQIIEGASACSTRGKQPEIVY